MDYQSKVNEMTKAGMQQLEQQREKLLAEIERRRTILRQEYEQKLAQK